MHHHLARKYKGLSNKLVGENELLNNQVRVLGGATKANGLLAAERSAKELAERRAAEAKAAAAAKARAEALAKKQQANKDLETAAVAKAVKEKKAKEDAAAKAANEAKAQAAIDAAVKKEEAIIETQVLEEQEKIRSDESTEDTEPEA